MSTTTWAPPYPEHATRQTVACEKHWTLARREARLLTEAHTHSERWTHAGRLQTQLHFLSALTGLTVGELADAVDTAAA